MSICLSVCLFICLSVSLTHIVCDFSRSRYICVVFFSTSSLFRFFSSPRSLMMGAYDSGVYFFLGYLVVKGGTLWGTWGWFVLVLVLYGWMGIVKWLQGRDAMLTDIVFLSLSEKKT